MERRGKRAIWGRGVPTKAVPLALVISGQIKPKALQSLGKNEEWLMTQLENHQFYKLEQVDYLFYEEHKLVIYTKQGIQKLTLK